MYATQDFLSRMIEKSDVAFCFIYITPGIIINIMKILINYCRLYLLGSLRQRIIL